MPTRVSDIVAIFLYGDGGVPSNFVDPALIRAPDDTTTVRINAVDHMAHEGRFATGAAAEIVIDFFEATDAALTTLFGAYSSGSDQVRLPKNEWAVDVLGLSSFGLQIDHKDYRDGIDDYAERVYVFGNQQYKVSDDAEFVIDRVIAADGSVSYQRHIDNFAIVPRNNISNPENFDFESSDLTTAITSPISEAAIDPSGLGRKVIFDFFGIENVQRTTYSEQDFADDQAEDAASNEPFGISPTNALALAEGVQDIFSDLFSAGITRTLDEDGRPIIFGTLGDDTFQGTQTPHGYNIADPSRLGFDLYLHEFLQNGLVYVGGIGNDTFRLASINEVVHAGGNKDVVLGSAGSDILFGGPQDDELRYEAGFGNLSISVSSTATSNSSTVYAFAAGSFWTDLVSEFELISLSEFDERLIIDDAAVLPTLIADGITISGMAGLDTLDFGGLDVGVPVDLGNAGQGDPSGNAGPFVDFENVIGSRFDDTIFGGSSDGPDDFPRGPDGPDGPDGPGGGVGNLLDGRGGDDFIDGGRGNDRILGGAGNDTLIDSADHDFVLGQDGDDQLFATLEFDLDNPSYEGAPEATKFVPGGLHDVIDGGAGEDTLTLSDPASIRVGEINGEVAFAISDLGFGTDIAFGIETLQGAGTIDFSAYDGPVTIDWTTNTIHMETHAITLDGDFWVITGPGDTTVIGDEGRTLSGGNGEDYLISGGGGSRLNGGAGSDTLVAQIGDAVSGGASDTLILDGVTITGEDLMFGTGVQYGQGPGPFQSIVPAANELYSRELAIMVEPLLIQADFDGNWASIVWDGWIVFNPDYDTHFRSNGVFDKATADARITFKMGDFGIHSTGPMPSVDEELSTYRYLLHHRLLNGENFYRQVTDVGTITGRTEILRDVPTFEEYSGISEDDLHEFYEFRDQQNGPVLVAGSDGADIIDASYVSVTGHTITGFGQTIDAGAGADDVYDGAGDDTVIGGSGNDRFFAGDGADQYDGGTDIDGVYYQASTAGLTIDMLTSTNSTGIAAGDTFVDVEKVYGTGLDDIIHLAADVDGHGLDGNDMLHDGAGLEHLSGGLGSDTFVLQAGDGAEDIIADFEVASDNIDLSAWGVRWFDQLMITATPTGTAGFVDMQVSYSGESLALLALSDADAAALSADDFVFQPAGPDLFGSSGNDRIDHRFTDLNGNGVVDVGQRIFGDGGADRIFDGAGDDVIYGDAGRDTFLAGAGSDVFIGGLDGANVTYVRSTSGLTIDMSDASNSTGDAFGDEFSDIIDMSGSDFNDIIYLSDGVRGFGGDGDDIIHDAGGLEAMTGHGGADTFVFGAGDGHTDYINRFEHGSDLIDLSAWGVTNFEQLNLAFQNIKPNGTAHINIIYEDEVVRLHAVDMALMDNLGAEDFIFATV